MNDQSSPPSIGHNSGEKPWSEAKKTKASLLRRAFKEARGGEVILMIQWLRARERHTNEKGQRAMRNVAQILEGASREDRALVLSAKHEKQTGVRFRDLL